MMRKHMISWSKQALQLLVMVGILSFALDWWRKPAQSLGFANQPLVTLHGQTLTLQDFSLNRTVAVYFWGSWCSICRHTSPAINRLHKAGVPVLGVAWQSGAPQAVAAYLQKHQWQFNTVNDADGSLARQWQIKAAPTIVLVKNGQVVHSTTGLSSYWGLRTRLWLANWS